MTNLQPQCQCPDESTGSSLDASWFTPEELKARCHKPLECPGDYEVKRYIRSGQEITLCSCCWLLGDIEIDKEQVEVHP